MGHDRLTDVDDLGRAGPEAVDAKDLQRFSVEQELEHADGAAEDLGSGEAFELGVSDFVGDLGGGELAFGPPERTNFGAGVDAGGDLADIVSAGDPLDQVSRGVSSLSVSGAGQRRGTDQVADGVDVRNGSLEVLIDLEIATAVAFDSERLETHSLGIAGASVGPQQDVGLQLFAGFEEEDDAIVARFDPLGDFMVTNQHAPFAEVIAEGIGDFIVEKIEKLVAGVDEIDLHSQVAKHRGVFAANDTGSVNGDRLRGLAEFEDGVAVEDSRVGEIHIGWSVGAGSGGEDEGVGGEDLFGAGGFDGLDGVGVEKSRFALSDWDVISIVEAAAHRHLLVDDRLRVAEERRKREIERQALIAEQGAVVDFHGLRDGETQNLAGNGGVMRAGSADLSEPLDDCHLAIALGAMHGGAFAAGSGTDDDDLVVCGGHGCGSKRESGGELAQSDAVSLVRYAEFVTRRCGECGG